MHDEVLAPAVAHGTFNWEVWAGKSGWGEAYVVHRGCLPQQTRCSTGGGWERAREWHTDSTGDRGWEGKRMACGW